MVVCSEMEIPRGQQQYPSPMANGKRVLVHERLLSPFSDFLDPANADLTGDWEDVVDERPSAPIIPRGLNIRKAHTMPVQEHTIARKPVRALSRRGKSLRKSHTTSNVGASLLAPWSEEFDASFGWRDDDDDDDEVLHESPTSVDSPAESTSEPSDLNRPLFTHRSLPTPDAIRTLVLLPSVPTDELIRCEIEIAEAGAYPAYTALSYSWGMHPDGDDTLNRSISIKGSILPIARNLYEGLLRLRLPHEPRRFWIDAVCINQHDLPERSMQVSRMAQIFAQASEVAVWLGEDNLAHVQSAILDCFGAADHEQATGMHTWPDDLDHEPVDFCSLRKATSSRKMKTARRVDHVSRNGSIRFVARRTSTMNSSITSSIESPALDSVIKALQSLFNRRYFRRRWVLQELYHSPPGKINLYFGSRTISLDTFAAVCGASIKDSRSLRRFIVGSRSEETQEWKGVQYGLREVERVIRLAKEKEKTTFLEALERSSHLLCSDPRDILYSLISLDPSFGFVPDYSLSTGKVYTQFAALLVSRGMWETVLDNLCANSASEDDKFLDDLPSWVPDIRKGFIQSAYLQGLQSADADVKDDGVSESSHATVIDGNVLRCSFYAIGVINFGTPWASPDRPPSSRVQEDGFDSWRRQLQVGLRLKGLLDVFELDGTQPYDAASMGDIVCSPRRIYTNEESVIVVLAPVKVAEGKFRIAQVQRGSDLKSLNGQNISELLHHSALPASAKFQALIV